MSRMKSFLEFHRVGFRLLKMIHDEDSTIIPLHLLRVCLSVTAVYVNLFLWAALIDVLILPDFRKAAGWAALLVAAEFGFGSAETLIKRRYRGMDTRIWLKFYVWIRKKAYSLDFETMENHEVSEKISYSERTTDFKGGLGILLYHYCEMLRSLLNILASTVLVTTLCFQRPAADKGIMGVLTEPGVSILLVAGMLALTVYFSLHISGKFAQRNTEMLQGHTENENKLAYLMHKVFMNYHAGKIIRIYHMEEMLYENGKKAHAKSKGYFEAMSDMGRWQFMEKQIVNGAFTIFSYVLVAAKVLTEAVTVGAFTQYTGAMNQFGSAFGQLIASNSQIQLICTYMREFLGFLDMESRHVKGTIPVEKRVDGEYELAFEDVSFHYPGSSETVLNHVSLKLDMKRRTAIVGKNGAGKTTFIKLLCRLYEPTEGRITLNGVDIRKYSEEEYRELFSVVSQDFKLFAAPVWENIVAGYERDDKRLKEALRLANGEGMVKNMPKGWDTYLYKDREEGVEISGGEAQKLALARALYKDAALVILDEPTAALDPLAEAEVYAGFDRMVEGKTSIYISHRMSSCRFCDDIIVMDQGRIVERGGHEALLEKDGEYADLWNAQAQYYTQGSTQG